jgi:hypothetical protein
MNKKIIKRIYNVVVVLFLVGAVAWCFSHFVPPQYRPMQSAHC